MHQLLLDHGFHIAPEYHDINIILFTHLRHLAVLATHGNNTDRTMVYIPLSPANHRIQTTHTSRGLMHRILNGPPMALVNGGGFRERARSIYEWERI